MALNEATVEAIKNAFRDKGLGRDLTKAQRMLIVLADGQWHSAKELSHVVTHRFSDVLAKMRDNQGIQWEGRKDPQWEGKDAHWQYRLNDPSNEPSLF